MIDYPQVALDFMNRDHEEFVALRENLLELLTHRAAGAEVDEMLDKLLHHTRGHFAEEERLMQETRFPPYTMHKMEHDRLLAVFIEQIELWRQHRDATSLWNFAQAPLADWFTNHVSTMDFVTARFIEGRQANGNS